ncbi:MAG: hypothetical protein QM755_13780 [Luteolibacter sp.]
MLLARGVSMFKKIISGFEKAQLNSLATKGGLACPACGTLAMQVPSEMNAVITCRSCGHFGSASEWAHGNAEGNRVGRAGHPPANTRIVREGAGSFTTWHIPPSGNGGGLVSFGWIWTIFMVVFSIGWSTPLWIKKVAPAIEVHSSKGSAGPMGALLLAGFFTLFWAIGLSMLYFGYRMKNAKHRVMIGNGTVTLLREWRGHRKEKSLPLADLQSISQVVFYSRNYQPVHGVELKGKSGKLRFGSGLKPEEKAWLVADFKAAVWPEKAAGPRTESGRQTGGTGSKAVFSTVVPGSAVGGVIFGIFFALMGGAFVAVGIWLIPGSHAGASGFGIFKTLGIGFQTIWTAMSSVFFLAGCGVSIASIRRLGTEMRIEGTARHVAVRTMKKGAVLKEQLFDRAQVRDIRASESGQTNGKPMKKLELIVGDKAERIAWWVDGEKADAVVDEVRAALG